MSDQRQRDPKVTAFLKSLAEALAISAAEAQVRAMMGRIYDAIEAPGPRGDCLAHRLPVCARLADALAPARAAPGPISRLADSFCEIEPLLRWAHRSAGGPFASENWLEGHANATIIGPNGLESRHDLQIGVSLMAPHVRYPDHSHPPEEVYLVLSTGRFQHGTSSWFEPGVGGTLYNEPNVRHAMASGDAPLLAIWCLWAG